MSLLYIHVRVCLDSSTDLVEAKVDTRKKLTGREKYHRTKEVGEGRDDL